MDFRPKGERVQVKNLVGHAVALSTAAALVTAAPAAAGNAEQNDSGHQQPSSTSSQQPAPSSDSSDSTSEKAPESTESTVEQDTTEETSTEGPTETSSVQESTTEQDPVEQDTTEQSRESTAEKSTEESTTSRSTASTDGPRWGSVFGKTPKNADEQQSLESYEAAPADAGEGAIQERYEGLDQQTKERVGQQEGDEVVVSDSLRYQDYSNARFYWSQQYGVKIVFGAVLDKYIERGGHENLGVPSTDELTTDDGATYNEFVHSYANGDMTSAVYDHSAAGTHTLLGPMLEKWRSAGGADRLGYPTNDTTLTSDRRGAFNHFENNASIFWTEATKAHVVRGLIREKWAATGWERGPMGYPASDELTANDGVGKYNHFSGVDGLPAGIVWHPDTKAHTVQGWIAQRYANFDGPNGSLGYPTTDERSTPDGRGRFNHFNGAGGASIYWTRGTKAQEIYGGIRDYWASMGWEKSYLGYPTTGEFNIEGGRRNRFEGGHISYYYDSGQIVDRRW